MKTEYWAALIVAALAGIWLWNQHDNVMGGLQQPPNQPTPDNELGRLTDSGAPHCHPEQHHAGYVYTAHRYPRAVGGEITAAIHSGWSSMRIPNERDVQWLIAPPSEVMF